MMPMLPSQSVSAALPPAVLAQAAGMQQGGTPPGGGAPMPAGGAAPPAGGAPMAGAPMAGGAMPGGAATPEQKLVAADSIAQQLVVLPDLARRQTLSALNKSDETLHALVTARMEKLRGQAASQGKAMILGQM